MQEAIDCLNKTNVQGLQIGVNKVDEDDERSNGIHKWKIESNHYQAVQP